MCILNSDVLIFYFIHSFNFDIGDIKFYETSIWQQISLSNLVAI